MKPQVQWKVITMVAFSSLAITGVSQEAKRAFITHVSFDKYVKVHGEGSGELAGHYVLVFFSRKARNAFLRTTNELADLRSICTNMVVVKIDYNAEVSGMLLREHVGWYIPFVVESAKPSSLKELDAEVEKRCVGGSVMDFYLILAMVSEAIQYSKCRGELICAVHASIAHTINRAIQLAMDAGLPKHSIELMRRGVSAMNACSSPSSHAGAAWFLWLQFSTVCPGWESQQAGEFKRYSQAVEMYAKSAKSPMDLVNAAWLHYNVSAFSCYSVFPGMAKKGLAHLNGILALEERCLQLGDEAREYHGIKILARQMISHAPRLEMHRRGLYDEIVQQIDLSDVSKVSHVKLSIRGLQVLPTRLGRNGKPRGIRFYHDGIAFNAVQLLGEDDAGEILRGVDRVSAPGIEFLSVGFQNQLNLVEDEFESFYRDESGKKPCLKVLPEFAYDADTDSGFKCKGKCGRQSEKPKAKKEKRAKAREGGRCEFKRVEGELPDLE